MHFFSNLNFIEITPIGMKIILFFSTIALYFRSPEELQNQKEEEMKRRKELEERLAKETKKKENKKKKINL